MRDLPRPWRIALFIIAVMLTVVIVIPAAILFIGYVVGFGACVRTDTGTGSALCSPGARLILALLVIAVGLPLSRMWVRYLGGTLSLDESIAPPRFASGAATAPKFPDVGSAELPVWQRVISGTVENSTRIGHTISFGKTRLTLWSIYPLEKGWLNERDRALIVYQQTPLGNFALAFWNPRLSRVRGIATAAQTTSVLIGSMSAILFAWLAPPLVAMWVAICGIVVAAALLYLALMMRAKYALRKFLESEALQ